MFEMRQYSQFKFSQGPNKIFPLIKGFWRVADPKLFFSDSDPVVYGKYF